MPFGVGGFDSSSNGAFDKRFSKKFDRLTDFGSKKPKPFVPRAFNFEPDSNEFDSETRFYNRDALWTRWRRGYDLYNITQTYLGSNSRERNKRGDFRMYMSFQQFPGVFIPARIFTFPSSSVEQGEHIVGIRDANSVNLYNFGLPIDSVRYLGSAVTGTYSQSGTTLTVSLADHGFRVGESVAHVFTTGNGVNETLAITSTTQNTFVCTASNSLTTSGNVTFRLSTAFSDLRWSEMRVKLRFLPPPVNFFKGERLTDRVIERDPGINSLYTQNGTTITVTTGQLHGLSTGNEVLITFSTGTATTGLYKVNVTGLNSFTVTSLASASTSGNCVVFRRVQGFDYSDYVGYTVTGTDTQTEEIIFQRTDSYGSKVIDNKPTIITPAHRGFTVGRFLTTEIRYQCSCSDFMRRENFDLYKESTKRRFPSTKVGSVKAGGRQDRDGNPVDTRDDVGVYSDFGYVAVNNFYSLPEYKDEKEFAFNNLLYYQARWCKHIYAAMWSIVHDEGNDDINIVSRYSQVGPNLTVTAPDHGLEVNTKVQLDFTSGNALDGQYTISSVTDKDNFVIIYPFSQTTSGYCVVQNLKLHEYIGAWLLEPNDQPLGIALEYFYDKLEKQNDRVRRAAERLSMLGYGLPWSGVKEILGDRNQPEEVGNFDDNVVSMIMTDRIKRNSDNRPDRAGVTKNKTSNLLFTMQKVFNIDTDLVQDAKIGMLDKPLTEYTAEFQFGEVDGGTYISGEPVSGETTSQLDCKTYSPLVEQVIFVDSGIYVNT